MTLDLRTKKSEVEFNYLKDDSKITVLHNLQEMRSPPSVDKILSIKNLATGGLTWKKLVLTEVGTIV